MNPELENNLNELINLMKDTASIELPAFAAEYLNWCFYEHVVICAFLLVVFLVLLYLP